MKKVLIFLFIAVFAIGVYAADFEYVIDGANLFTPDEEAYIAAEADKIYDESGLLTVVLTEYGVGDVLNNLYTYASGASDMIMLTVDMAEREFEIYQYNTPYGESAFRLSYDESQNVLDCIFDDMASGYYANAALMFVEMASEAFVNGDDFVSGDYDGYEYVEYEEDLWIGALILSLGAGIVIGGISVLCVWLSYKRKARGSKYPLSQYSKLNLTASNDNFLRKSVIVTRIPDPPSGSGGSSGGSRGGGGARMGGRNF